MKLLKTTLNVVPGTPVIPFSAQTKQGREEIWELIEQFISMPAEEAPEQE